MYVTLVENLQENVPMHSLFLKYCKFIGPKYRNDSAASKAFAYLGDKTSECFKTNIYLIFVLTYNFYHGFNVLTGWEGVNGRENFSQL